MKNISWGRSERGAEYKNWPKLEDGKPEAAAFLCHCISNDFSAELKMNMLDAYSIPSFKVFPGDGGFGKIICGMSGEGVDIYVPESLLEEALALCESSFEEDPENV